MLILPVSGKIGFKKTPLVTLALLFLNCFIFLLFQIDDDQRRMEAEQFYLNSGLAEMELTSYIYFLEATNVAVEQHELTVKEMDTNTLMNIHLEMESDDVFLDQLVNGRIITPDDPQYDEWRELRATYEKKRDRCVAFSYGLRPAYPRLSAFFTYMFLHGGVDHLMGNMVFLWFLGCMIEIGAGWALFTATYLLSGLFSAGLFYLVYPASTVPLVGASGAIAGLMGAYTVWYGLRKVHVFYSLGFYFNTATIPAIFLLPIWLANECYQLFFSGSAHVAYVAHIGGLIAGSVFMVVGIRVFGIHRKRFYVPLEDRVTPFMNNALEHLGNIDMVRAQAAFEKVLEISPDNRKALMHLFHIHKLHPNSHSFHETTAKLIRMLILEKADHQEALSVYETYCKLTPQPKLPTAVYLQITGIMANSGYLDRAEKIVMAILKNKPQSAGLPSSLMKLAVAFQKMDRMDQWKRCRKLVCDHFPDSVEAAMVMKADTSN